MDTNYITFHRQIKNCVFEISKELIKGECESKLRRKISGSSLVDGKNIIERREKEKELKTKWLIYC
jgi:hypothetical protein